MKNWQAITIDNYHLEQKNSMAINSATLNGSTIFALYHMSMAGDVGLIARIVFQVFSTNME